MFLSICLPIFLFIYLSIYFQSICLSISLYVCLSIYNFAIWQGYICTKNTIYSVFEKYCPIPLFAQVLIVFSLVSNKDKREFCSLRRYCMRSVQFNEYPVAQLLFIYHNSRQSSYNILNLRIGQYFPDTLYHHLISGVCLLSVHYECNDILLCLQHRFCRHFQFYKTYFR